ncbi:hypothetical protein lbkm_0158 [Lachnospiraceae bacterium KM106-2]|nr:hypothetical protein lbkm_0158 [Lachnospiraceae bacterium KM106-2]
MTRNEFLEMEKRICDFQYTSLGYCDYDDVEGYEVIEDSKTLLCVKGYDVEAGMIQYHWAADHASWVVGAILESPCYLTFVPKGWVKEFEQVGLRIRNRWHDYFMKDFIQIKDEATDIEFLKVEECEGASKVTMACRGQSRGFTGQTVQWIRDWVTGADEFVRNCRIVIERNEVNEIVGIVCTGTYGHESEKGPTCWIREVAVVPEYQNRGIARKLITQALSFGKSLGATRAYLAADEQNAGAIHLYESLGFVASEEESEINMIRE